jgi:hypothetical protein
MEPRELVMDYCAKTKLIEWAAGEKEGKTFDSLREELQGQIKAFAGSDPSPIEQTLAETAAMDWFAVRLYELSYANASRSEKGLTLTQADFQLRRIEGAHRRFLRTLKTLATIRRFALPAVQINVARQQVNQLRTGTQHGGDR